jgi:hypothetical protein
MEETAMQMMSIFSALFSWIYSSEFKFFYIFSKSETRKMVIFFLWQISGEDAGNNFFLDPGKLYDVADSFRIRIRRIQMFLGFPEPDPLVGGTDPGPAIIEQK